MLHRFRLRRGATIAVAAAAALAAVGAVSVASGAIPGSGGTIDACYNAVGELRVIDKEAGKACANRWTPLSWNQQGVKGDTGPQGPQGLQGPKGDPGTVDTSKFYDKTASDARFLGETAKAADADKLDGLDSTRFFHGHGDAVGAAVAVPVGGRTDQDVGPLRVSFVCTNVLTATANNRVEISSRNGDTVNLFVESGGDNPNYWVLDKHPAILQSAPNGDSFHVQAQGNFGVATAEIAAVHRNNDCHFQIQWMVTQQVLGVPAENGPADAETGQPASP